MKNWKYIWLAVILFPLVGMVSSCSEDNTAQEDEFADWQKKNETVIEQWAANPAYRKILTYTKNADMPGLKNTDYIYVEVLEEGSGTETALFTDSVLYTYRGRLIPTKSYEKGYVFEQTFLGDFNWATANMQKACVSWNPVQTSTGVTLSLFTPGFCTALQYMKKGDRWLVHIPYELAYGESASDNGNIPAYSNLIFEIAVSDIWHPKKK